MDDKSLARIDGLGFFTLGAVIFVLLGVLWHPIPELIWVDFKPLYNASQTLLDHQDPYSPATLLRHYSTAVEHDTQLAPGKVQMISLCTNLPSTLVLLAPIVLFSWKAAAILWTALNAASFVLAAYLMWRVSAAWSPRTAGVLVLIFLAGSQMLLEAGNAAGIVVSFCVIAAVAFVHERFAKIGVILLAISLLVKPQDAGLVWLYFLLAGGVYRRRALETLVIAAAVFLPAIAWVHHISPHWMDEWKANLANMSFPGHIDDPSPQSTEPAYRGSMVASLQTISSIFFASPRTYNLIAYSICGPLLAIWAWTVMRARRTVENAWFALAAIAPLSMLPLYHRQSDTRLMILAIPACAFLWSRRGTAGRLALAVATLAALMSANLVVQILGTLSFNARHSAVGFRKEIMTATLARPIPVSMLLMAIFFCWYWARLVFWNNSNPPDADSEPMEVAGDLILESIGTD